MVSDSIASLATRAAVAVDIGASGVRAWAKNDFAEGEDDRCESRPWAEHTTSLIDDLSRVRSVLGQVVTKPNMIGRAVVSFPGAVSSSGRVSLWPNRPIWVGFDLKGFFCDVLPGLSIEILDDAVCAGFGIVNQADFSGGKRGGLLYVGLGTGVGGAYIPPNQTACELTAKSIQNVEFGHLIVDDRVLCSCGRRGCVQAYARSDALLNLPPEKAARAVDTAAQAVATAAVNLAQILPIDVMVLGGGTLRAVHDLDVTVRRNVVQLTRLGGRTLAVKVIDKPEQASLAGARLLSLSLSPVKTLVRR